MKRYTLPILTAAGGVGCLILRTIQNSIAFEPDTGLPIPSHPLSILLPAVLLLLTATALLLALRCPASPAGLQDGFRGSPAALTLTVTGIFLWLLSAASDVIPGLTGEPSVTASPIPGLYLPADPAAARLDIVSGLLLTVAALALLPAAAACRKGGKRFASAAPSGNLLLIPPVALVIRLALEFREMSVDASQQRYYVELLALVLLIPALFELASFAFRCGKTSRLLFFSAAASLFCLTALTDGSLPGGVLFHAGGAALTLGFMLLHLSATTSSPLENE